MDVLTKAEVCVRYDDICQRIKEGALFIHPTDTIYGLGCIALDDSAVRKLRRTKGQTTRPLSVWVPSAQWIHANCLVTEHAREWLQKLPGPFTVILRLKKRNAVAASVTLGTGTIGVRFPDHWFGKVVEKCGFPIVTTSANKTGQPFMTDLKTLDQEIEKRVEFAIYEGEKEARPSKIVDTVKGVERER